MKRVELHKMALNLFDQVCDLPNDERTAYLSQHCHDPQLREEVEALLRHDEANDSFIDGERPSAALDAMAAQVISDVAAEYPDRIGQYKIIRKIGEGGMGIIYEAEQESPRRRVALKVLRPGMMGRSMLKRFEHEAHMLGQLQHPGIAQIYEAGLAALPQGRQPFFAMEYIDGETLDRYANAHDLDTNQRMELMARVCDAVQHAHQKGIIHRDLKPSNVLVVSHQGSDATKLTKTSAPTGSMMDHIGQPKVLDFGIARATDADLQVVTVQTEVGQLVGTLAYMGPEQVAGRSDDLDTRCDVYALGVMLYELLASQRPYDLGGLPVTEAVRIIREETPPRLGTINRRLRGDVETIVEKAMEKSRERRYSSAVELAADIRRQLSGAPIDARPASTFYQFSRFAKRNTGLVAGVAAAILALSVGLAFATWNAHLANQATQLAQEEGERAMQALADVELVADFQGAIVKSANMPAMGKLILDEVAAQVGERDSSTDVKTTLKELNAASIARAVVDASLLRKASETARKQFSERPTLEADIHESLADTYFVIGMYEQSLNEAQAALSLRREHLGDDHSDTIKMIGNVCHILNNLRRSKEAEPYAEEALNRLRAAKSEDDKLVLEAYYRLVFTKRGLKEFDEALALSQKLVETAQRTLDQEDNKLLTYRQQLAMIYTELGRHEESLAIREDVLEAYRREFDANSPRVLGCASQVAMTLKRLGRLEESEEAFAVVVERAEKSLGATDPRTMRVLKSLAIIRAERGQTELARENFASLLERQRKTLAPDHPAINQTIETIRKLNNDGEESATSPVLEGIQ